MKLKNLFVSLAVTSVMLLAAVVVFAGEDDFQEQKDMVLSNISNLEASLKKERACVDSAKTKKELRACYDQFREEKKRFLNSSKPVSRQQGKGFHERIGN